MSKEKNDVSKEENAAAKKTAEAVTEKSNSLPVLTKDQDEGSGSQDENSDNPNDDPDKKKNFADQLYNEITSVLDGNNPNQFFCMSLPGTLIDPNMYSYDVDSNMIKPAHVKANESKLADRLFDPAFVCSSNNGRHLSAQYRTALNMLTPKLNEKLFEAKTKLRDVLMTPYPYNFGDGKDDVLTLEQVFYRLYGEYVAAKEKWGKKQLTQLQNLQNKYSDNTPESKAKINDEYLEWYGLVAEAEELIVEDKLGKVLGVFSPGDMEIIAGILESGSGRELEEARQAMENVAELDPDGGYVYPVNFYPQDWFNKLDSSFTGMDLLESPAALAQRMLTLTTQRKNITSQIANLTSLVPTKEEEKRLQDVYDACEKTYHSEFAAYCDSNTGVSVDMFSTVISAISSYVTGDITPKNIINDTNKSIVSRLFGNLGDEKITEILTKIGQSAKKCLDAQNALITASSKAVSAAMNAFQSANQAHYKEILDQLNIQLTDVNDKIDDLKNQMVLSSKGLDNKDTSVSKVIPNNIPDGFTQIVIDAAFSSVENRESNYTSASESNVGVSFFFGGYSSNSEHQEAYNQVKTDNEDMEIQVGMSVAKVEIDREWFNPGVFMLTSDMYNTSSTKISPPDNIDNLHDYEKGTARLSAMAKCVFPCFPTAFVIAKDVTVKFVSKQAISEDFAKSVEEHSSKGGGFFIFSGSSSSASSSSSSYSSANSTTNTVTVRFTAPQILGYYLEAVAPDKSLTISEAAYDNSNADFVSIFEFITDFKKMLDDHNQKYNPKLFGKKKKAKDNQ